jgi:hypothetical protein
MGAFTANTAVQFLLGRSYLWRMGRSGWSISSCYVTGDVIVGQTAVRNVFFENSLYELNLGTKSNNVYYLKDIEGQGWKK